MLLGRGELYCWCEQEQLLQLDPDGPSVGTGSTLTGAVKLLWSRSVSQRKGGKSVEVAHKWIQASGHQLDHTATET